jgi:hypothetical protein
VPTVTWSYPGTYYQAIPPGATNLIMQCWGAGGGGGSSINGTGGGGGGGGGYQTITVTNPPGGTYTVNVGGGGAQDTDGEYSFVQYPDASFPCVAFAGTAGLRDASGGGGGLGGNGIYSGGNGGAGDSQDRLVGGGGGGCASSGGGGEYGADGVNGGGGGAGGTPDGGAGGNGDIGDGSGPGGGSNPGGGGGGGSNYNNGASGADGQVTLTWTNPPPSYTPAQSRSLELSRPAAQISRPFPAGLLASSPPATVGLPWRKPKTVVEAASTTPQIQLRYPFTADFGVPWVKSAALLTPTPAAEQPPGKRYPFTPDFGIPWVSRPSFTSVGQSVVPQQTVPAGALYANANSGGAPIPWKPLPPAVTYMIGPPIPLQRSELNGALYAVQFFPSFGAISWKPLPPAVYYKLGDPVPPGNLNAIALIGVSTSPPPPPPPPVGTIGVGRRFVPQIPRAAQVTDDRVRPHIDSVVTLLNSLLRMGYIRQTDHGEFAISAGAFQLPRDPTVTDDETVGAQVGSLYINTATNSVWINTGNGRNAATWLKIKP